MPSETDPHERTWMAWPSSGYTLGDTTADADTARRTWASVAHAVADFEPVTMVVDPSDTAIARSRLSTDVDILEAPLDDAWMRDIGPTFVVSADGRLGAVDWVFNGWGQQSWAMWDRDARIGRVVGTAAGAEIVPSPLVNEGGGFHVDGLGTVLLTETVQRGEGRNPDLSHEDVAAELGRTIGATQCIWLPRGLTRDYDEFGTRGHVDIVATFPSPGVVLLHWQGDPGHPDRAVSEEVDAVLRTVVDARGAGLHVVHVPAPVTVRDAKGWVDWSYINHLVVDGGVIACTFDDPRDDAALGVLADAYPGRTVIGVDARPLFDRGGGIHCITQQQPAV